MLRSMTGFGVAEVAAPGCKIGVELRSVNHRFLDVALRLPRPLLAFEDQIKTRLRERIDRGRLSLTFTFEAREEIEEIELNAPLVRAYARAGQEVAELLGLQGGLQAYPQAAGPLIATILALPDVLNRTSKLFDEDVIRATLARCIDASVAQAN